MSRKPFEALAAEIAKIEDEHARKLAAAAVMRACANERFDAGRFLAACNAI